MIRPKYVFSIYSIIIFSLILQCPYCIHFNTVSMVLNNEIILYHILVVVSVFLIATI